MSAGLGETRAKGSSVSPESLGRLMPGRKQDIQIHRKMVTSLERVGMRGREAQGGHSGERLPPRPIGICEFLMTSTQPGKCVSTLWCVATSLLAAPQESKDWENLLPQCRKTWSNSAPCRAQSFHQTMCMICWPASHCHCRIHPLRVCLC